MDGESPIKKLTPTQKLDQKIRELEKEKKELNSKIISTIKESSGQLQFNTVTVGIEYEIDLDKKVKLGLSAKLNGMDVADGHEKVYMELLSSLGNIIDLTMADGSRKED